MAWRVELSDLARKNVRRLDEQTRARVLNFLEFRIAELDDPRSPGGALQGAKLGSLWKYRVGDTRIIADIRDEEVCILVVRIGNRGDVYR